MQSLWTIFKEVGAFLVIAGALAISVVASRQLTRPLIEQGWFLFGLVVMIIGFIFLMGGVVGSARGADSPNHAVTINAGTVPITIGGSSNPPRVHSQSIPTTITGQPVQLSEYVSWDTPVIRGRTFENCTIYGPAILVSLSPSNVLANSGFDGTPESTIWVVDADERPQLSGAIGMIDCVFRNCRFRNVGLVITPEQLDDTLRGFGVPPPQ